MTAALSLEALYAHPLMLSTPLCPVGLAILAHGGNPFAVGQESADHSEGCAACGNDALATVNDLEGHR